MYSILGTLLYTYLSHLILAAKLSILTGFFSYNRSHFEKKKRVFLGDMVIKEYNFVKSNPF